MVATAFPPLKRANNGKQCPIPAERPATTVVISLYSIKEAIELLCKSFKPIGPITVQLIREENTGIDYYIEINPRFGGGAPLSIKAGADSAEALLRLLRNEKMAYIAYAAEDGAVYSRFDQSIRII